MCIVCIANNINRNVYMYLNTRIFPDYWLRMSAVIHVYKARARRNGYRMFNSVYILWDVERGISPSKNGKLTILKSKPSRLS